MNIQLGFEKTGPPCLGVCHGNYKLFLRYSRVQWGRLCISDLKGGSSICSASSNSQWNRDSSTQNGSSYKSRGWQNQGNEITDESEDTEFFPPKNGRPRYPSTATPAQRKIIVELFRKTQVLLKERDGIKEEKKVEATQQGQADQRNVDTTIDILNQLFKKHSVQKGKKSNGSENYNVNHSEKNNLLEEKHNSSLSEIESFTTAEGLPDPKPATARPVSKFQRKSPVTGITRQPISHAGENSATDSLPESRGSTMTKTKKETAIVEPDMELLIIDDSEDQFDDEPSSLLDLDDVEEKITEQSNTESPDLNSMKLSELRALAKTRGMKRYSKLNKVELVDLLK